ncbi:MAG: glycosyltransferase family 39 protein [Anaerolineae bacterium]
MVGLLLIATAFRFLAADSAPPGWRDDELIEYGMDRRIADGWRPLFITEAEGHEPVYHYLHAGTLLLFGDNLIGYKWLPLACGLISIALTFALARKMFDDRIALLAAALMAVSFWPIMYARFGVRHIGTLPWMLAAFYLLYPGPATPKRRPIYLDVLRVLGGGICLAAGLMTYFAGRAVPIVLAGFLGYLLIFQRSILKRVWWRYVLAIAIGVVIAAPMFIEIANTPGAEKRTEVVGGPLIELRKGNVQPAIETTLGTLGMFTFAGDPESLYNVPNRPVFDWLTGAFFYLGVIVCLIRLKRTESGFALAWLMIGLAPAFVSVPAASFSHTIVALPVVYVLTAYGAVLILDRMTSRQRLILSSLRPVILSGLILLNGALTLRDYFGTWAQDDFVRFQYHAPTRDIAKWLDQNSQIMDVAVGTHVTELQLDPVALRLDLKRNDLKARWFNPERALVIPRWFDHKQPIVTPATGTIIVSSMQSPSSEITARLSADAALVTQQPTFAVYAYKLLDSAPLPSDRTFDNSVTLWAFRDSVTSRPRPGEADIWQTDWKIEAVNRSRLKLFFHLLTAADEVVVGDDREDINWAALQPGDRLIQLNQVNLPADLAPGKYPVEVGWYDPVTSERLNLADGASRYLIDVVEVRTP